MATDHHVPRLGPTDAGRAVSSEEFACAVFEEPWRYERVEGRLVIVAPAGEDHVSMSEPWRDLLGAYKPAHPEIVQRVVSESWVRVDDANDRIGDIGVYLVTSEPRGRIPDRVPELMFEFVSPGRKAQERDDVRKRQDDLRFGIREYVNVDRAAGIVTVHTRGPRGYRSRVLKSSETYTSPFLPGFAVTLAEVL